VPVPRVFRGHRCLLLVAMLVVAPALVARRPIVRETRLVVWTDVRGGGALRVSVDGEPMGALNRFFPHGSPSCSDARGALVLRLAPGRRTIRGYDQAGRSWRVTLRTSGDCQSIRFGPVSGLADRESQPADSGRDERPIGGIRIPR
jgi:hypothetical protein